MPLHLLLNAPSGSLHRFAGVSQAEVEGWRTSNLWGLFTWQYNEIWPCGGWGSIEYVDS